MPRKNPAISFICVVDLSPAITWKYVSESCLDLLGYEPSELVGTSPLTLLRPDEADQSQLSHLSVILNDKAATIAYLHLRHKDPEKGFILVAASRTVVEDVVVGSITLAVPGPGAMHTIATATEVDIVAPEAIDFAFHKWVPERVINEPAPPEPSSAPADRVLSPSSSTNITQLLDQESEESSQEPSSNDESHHPLNEGSHLPSSIQPLSYPPLPKRSLRLAVVLDRFSRTLTISYMSNTRLLPPIAQGRSFFDFVRARDERLVRSWLEAVKGWDAGAGGLGAGGGFGYGRFGVVLSGRNSRRRESGSRQRREADENGAIDVSSNRAGDVGRAQKTTMTRAARERRTASIGSQFRTDPDPDVVIVDGIFSAHSDGLLVILKPVENKGRGQK